MKPAQGGKASIFPEGEKGELGGEGGGQLSFFSPWLFSLQSWQFVTSPSLNRTKPDFNGTAAAPKSPPFEASIGDGGKGGEKKRAESRIGSADDD